jgi:DUF1680 family protein
MKVVLYAVALCAAAFSMGCTKSATPEEISGVQVRFKGMVGAKFDALVKERCQSEDARGSFYEETLEAFRTHYDDTIHPDHGFWQNEYWGKNTLGLIAGARYADDKELIKEIVSKSRAFVKEFQREDGSITTYKDVRFVVPKDPERAFMCWNLWGRKYTLWALLEVYLVSKDKFFLDAASKLVDQQIAMLKDMSLKLRDTGCFSGLPSLSVLKPVLILYKETKDPKYLSYAHEIVAEMDDPDESNPPPNLVRNAFRDLPVSGRYPVSSCDTRRHTKAYEMLSCFEGLIEYSRITGDNRALRAAELTAERLYKDEINVMCAVGYADRFASAARRVNAATEYCDVIHWVRLCRDLYEATGDEKHLDRLEKAFFNAALAGFYRDGKWTTHFVRSHGYGHFTAPQQVGMKYHQCCVDNAPRLAGVASEIAVRSLASGVLEVNLYSDLQARFSGGELEISGNYPVGDEVVIRLSSKEPRSLRLRVPSWCAGMKINGEKVEGPYALIASSTGGEWMVSFEMPVKVISRSASAPLDPAECPDADALFTAIGHSPKRISPVRREFACYVMKGPLLLAKTAKLGDTEDEIFNFSTLNGLDVKPVLEPIAPEGGVWGAWKLILTTPCGKRVETKVSDYATAADDDGYTAFSVWF